ncbi:MAG: HEPN domain-containing protein [Parcubacteria group bacterium]|nr:HEPN domain-containing protein [Parcubacteria group bacterium]
MITYKELQKIAKTRLEDSRILYKEGRYNGAIYICGYTNELALKAIICKRLKLLGIPNHSYEFQIIKDIKTHNLEELLKLLAKLDKNISDEILNNRRSDWNIVLDWNPERRYLPIDEKSSKQWKYEAEKLIKSTTKISKYFWGNL